MSRKRDRKNLAISAVGMEITPSSIFTVICTESETGQAIRMIEFDWNTSDVEIKGDFATELTSALTHIVREHRLTAQTVNVVLDSEFCISRYRRGDETDVRRHLEMTERHAQRYLQLGYGRKVAATMLRSINDEDYEGQLTACNYRCLASIAGAFKAAGLTVDSIRASSNVLAGLVPSVCTSSGNGLLIHSRESGAHLSLIDGGRQILEIRPAEKMSTKSLYEYVAGRFALMDRFIEQNGQSEQNAIGRLLVFGENGLVDLLAHDFACCGVIVENLNERLADLPWFAEQPHVCAPSKFSGALGAVFGRIDGTEQINAPDLIDVLRAEQEEAVRLPILRAIWPIAASLLMCLGLMTLIEIERKSAVQLNGPLLASRQLSEKLKGLEAELLDVEYEAATLRAISVSRKQTDWKHLLTLIAGCLDDDASLETIEFDNRGEIRMAGTSIGESQVYEFIESIQGLSAFSGAAVSGIQRGSSDKQGEVVFEAEAQIAKEADGPSGEVDRA